MKLKTWPKVIEAYKELYGEESFEARKGSEEKTSFEIKNLDTLLFFLGLQNMLSMELTSLGSFYIFKIS